MSTGTYDQALSALSTLISQQKRTKGESWENAFAAMQVFLEVCKLVLVFAINQRVYHPAVSEISLPSYVQRLQLQDSLKNLKVIHVAGTKGKVRQLACNMMESILPL